MTAQEEVLSVELEWTQAHIAGDFAVIEHLMAEDYHRINPDGSVTDKQTTLASYQPEARHWDNASSDQHEILLNDNTAVLIGRWQAKGINNGVPFDYAARFMSVYVKREGRWLMLAEQSTDIRNKHPKAA